MSVECVFARVRELGDRWIAVQQRGVFHTECPIVCLDRQGPDAHSRRRRPVLKEPSVVIRRRGVALGMGEFGHQDRLGYPPRRAAASSTVTVPVRPPMSMVNATRAAPSTSFIQPLLQFRQTLATVVAVKISGISRVFVGKSDAVIWSPPERIPHSALRTEAAF